MRRAFQALDRRGNGILEPEDFRYALKRMDILLGERQFLAFMRLVDANGDGTVSYAEFLKFMRDGEPGSTRKVSGLSVEQAVALMREKIVGRMEGGNGWMRR